MFQTVPLSIVRFSLCTQQWYMSYGFADSLWAGSWACSQAVSKPVRHIPLLCAQWKTPDDGQRKCTKHAEFYSKNKFEKLVHLVGFIIRTCYECLKLIFHILSLTQELCFHGIVKCCYRTFTLLNLNSRFTSKHGTYKVLPTARCAWCNCR